MRLPPVAGLSPKDAAEIEASTQSTAQLAEQVAELTALLQAQDVKVDGNRARILRAANVRIGPSRTNAIQYRLAPNEVVAIRSRDGRWRHIVYHDVLTGSLAEGWVYSTLIEELARR